MYSEPYLWVLSEDCGNFYCLKKKYLKSFYNIFYPESSNFLNLGLTGRRKLPDPSINNIFNTLSIGLQYTLSFN